MIDQACPKPTLESLQAENAELRAEIERYANFHNAILEGAWLSGADLLSANLENADLGGANLHGANLQFADLSGASLREANLSFADLRNATLTETDVSGADFPHAHLADADLFSALDLTQDQINVTVGNRLTALPYFNERPKHWDKVIEVHGLIYYDEQHDAIDKILAQQEGSSD